MDVEEQSGIESFALQFSDKIFIIAISVYVFSYVGQDVARVMFVRQMSHIAQLLRLFLVLGGILPSLIHSQVSFINPHVRAEVYPWYVSALLLVNILVAYFSNQLFIYAYNQAMCTEDNCKQPPPGKKAKKASSERRNPAKQQHQCQQAPRRRNPPRARTTCQPQCQPCQPCRTRPNFLDSQC